MEEDEDWSQVVKELENQFQGSWPNQLVMMQKTETRQKSKRVSQKGKEPSKNIPDFVKKEELIELKSSAKSIVHYNSLSIAKKSTKSLKSKKSKAKQLVQKSSNHEKLAIKLIEQGESMRTYNQITNAFIFTYKGYGIQMMREIYQQNNIEPIHVNDFKNAMNSVFANTIRKMELLSQLHKHNVQPFFSQQIFALVPNMGHHQKYFPLNLSTTLTNIIKQIYEFEPVNVSQMEAIELHRYLLNILQEYAKIKNKETIYQRRKVKAPTKDEIMANQNWTPQFQKDFIEHFAKCGSLSVTRRLLSKQYGSNQLLNNMSRLKAKYEQLARQALRKVQELSLTDKAVKCAYLTDHKIRYLIKGKDHIDVRRRLLKIYQMNENQIDFALLNLCVNYINEYSKKMQI